MLEVSRRIMQLPLSRGGLSLRLPISIFRIAYSASCIDCSPTVALAAAALRIRKYDPYDFGELRITAEQIYSTIPIITHETFSMFFMKLVLIVTCPLHNMPSLPF